MFVYFGDTFILHHYQSITYTIQLLCPISAGQVRKLRLFPASIIGFESGRSLALINLILHSLTNLDVQTAIVGRSVGMKSRLVPTQFPGYDNESEDDDVVLQFRAYELGQAI